MKFIFAMLVLAFAFIGCTTNSNSQMRARQAFLEGQNAALKQQAASSGVTVIGAVQNSFVPWVAGLTLAQVVATANYLEAKEPEAIILTRQGESATLPPGILFSGAVVPLEPGDVVEIR